MFDDVEHNIAQLARGAWRNHFFPQLIEPFEAAFCAPTPAPLAKSSRIPGLRHWLHEIAEALGEK